METEYVVRFSSYPRPFLVRDSYCDNPDCRCRKVCLNFTEVNDTGRSQKKPLAFSIHVDVDTWQEGEEPDRPPEITAWVHEFLDQCPPPRRAEYRASYNERKRIARRKAEYRLHPKDVLEGLLVSYVHVLDVERPLSAGGKAYTFDVAYQGREFLVEDRYCPNPHCDCQEVLLEFYEAHSQENGRRRIDQRFLGKVTFAGELTVQASYTCSLDEANAVFSAWWEQFGHELQMLAARYHDVKEIGQRSLDAPRSRSLAARQMTRSLPARDMVLDDPAEVNARVGRNAACPCGSGKKYKKCCGRTVVLPS